MRVLGTRNSDFLLISLSPSVGLPSVPIDLMSHISWWTAFPRPEDALPPIVGDFESEVIVRFQPERVRMNRAYRTRALQ